MKHSFFILLLLFLSLIPEAFCTNYRGTPLHPKGNSKDFNSGYTVAEKFEQQQVSSKEKEKLTAIGKLLAGFKIEEGKPYSWLMKTSSWKAHRQFFVDLWQTVDSSQLNKIRTWAKTQLDPATSGHPQLLYPFSGPDYLYAYTLFPNATHILMMGLEPVGEVPSLDAFKRPAKLKYPQKEVGFAETELNASLKSIQKSLDDILRWSFFKTIDMAVDFRYNKFKGVIPILMTFITKTGHEILSVEKVYLDKYVRLQPSTDTLSNVQKGSLGVRITFRKHGSGTLKTLTYLQTNLGDYPYEGMKGLPERPELVAYIKKMYRPVTFIKSASYLMHKSYFSFVRELILNESEVILEDDSGIPYRFFNLDKWEVQLYGKYVGPIRLFGNWFQNDLDQAYKKSAKNIDFGIGYQYRVNRSNLLLARPKKSI